MRLHRIDKTTKNPNALSFLHQQANNEGERLLFAKNAVINRIISIQIKFV